MRWAELPEETREQLEGRLAGLYEHPTDESAFDSLQEDKRHALLIFVRSFSAFGIWRAVRSVVNVYGLGGVGIAFVADDGLFATLASHPRFTPRFAGHGGKTAAGFYEKGRPRAALHVLQMRDDPRSWQAHFDAHGPLGGPASLVRHIWGEVVRGHRPDWREIEAALGDGARDEV